MDTGEVEAAEVEAHEVDGLDEKPEVPPQEELVDGVALVAGVIASLHGGHSGLNPYQTLGIADQGGGVLEYSLTDRRSGAVQRFTVTIEPQE